MASNNDRRIYYDLNSGQKYVLFEESITSGGEGSIYNIEGMPDLVAKIYHEKNRTENRKINFWLCLKQIQMTCLNVHGLTPFCIRITIFADM